MIRFRCNQCGKIVEYLRKYHKDCQQLTCSCGGKLLPINANNKQDMEELTKFFAENYHDDKYDH